MTQNCKVHVTEDPEVLWVSVLLGYGPMLLFVAAAILSWLLDGDFRNGVIQIGAIYGASILTFLGGVRRGSSFWTEGGPKIAQMGTMAGLWLMAFFALLSISAGMPEIALGLLIIGYLVVMILDPIAARAGQAPLFFVRLRPPQMAIAVASFVALFASAACTL